MLGRVAARRHQRLAQGHAAPEQRLPRCARDQTHLPQCRPRTPSTAHRSLLAGPDQRRPTGPHPAAPPGAVGLYAQDAGPAAPSVQAIVAELLDHAAAQGDMEFIRDFAYPLFAERRAEPREDLISNLVNVHLDGDALTEEELLSTCVTILIGGHETTTSLLASATLLLVTQTDLAHMLRDAPDQWPSAVEEFLRYQPPFQRILRLVR